MTSSAECDVATVGPPALTTVAVPAIAALLVGLAVGFLTSILQGHLGDPWLSLVNSASPWLAAMFAVGAFFYRALFAAVAGLATGVSEVVGYYVTATLRDYPVAHAPAAFWLVCAAIGGPLFGSAGWAWSRRTGRLSSLGASMLPAAFLAEAAVAYGLRLHYLSSAVLFGVLGVASIALLGARRRPRVAIWLLVTFPLGAVAEVILGLISSRLI